MGRKTLLPLELISRQLWPEAGRSREVKSTGRQVHLNRLTGTWIMVMMIIIIIVANTDYNYVPSTVLGRIERRN